MASPHVAGAVALYLQGRTGTDWCAWMPKQGTSPFIGGAISTCPDRVAQFIKSNASLNKLSDIGPGSPNRLLFTGSLPTTVNPIDNQRFYVWQHYADFLVNEPEPDVLGLDFWTGNITGTCGTGLNDNNGCTHVKRIDVSRAFWVAAFPSFFTNAGNNLTNNAAFVHKCYEVYLRRSVSSSDGGFQFWLNSLNQFGNPANQNGINHLIDAFTEFDGVSAKVRAVTLVNGGRLLGVRRLDAALVSITPSIPKRRQAAALQNGCTKKCTLKCEHVTLSDAFIQIYRCTVLTSPNL